MTNRVLLLWAGNRVAIDVALAGSPFEKEALERATEWIVESGKGVVTCSAEDLILYKLVAGRSRDLADIEGIARRQRERLDVDRIRRYAALFAELKEEPELAQPFEEALAKAQSKPER